MTAINLPEPSHRPGKQDLAFTPPSPELSFERETPTLRALSLLEFLVAADRPLSPAEILQGFDAPKASLHRMLSALVAGGLVVREPGPRNIYTVGPRLARLGLAIVTRSGPKQLRHAVLTKLVEDIGETVNVTVLHESSILYLDRIEAPWPLRLDLQPGSRVPLHCSASGKLLLSALPGINAPRSCNSCDWTASRPIPSRTWAAWRLNSSAASSSKSASMTKSSSQAYPVSPSRSTMQMAKSLPPLPSMPRRAISAITILVARAPIAACGRRVGEYVLGR